jgi:hypothetical protein
MSELELVDMAALRTCRSFELPRGAGAELRRRLGVSQQALFPDVVDFGYSYFAVATFLSMAIHEPGYFGPAPRKDDGLQKIYDRGGDRRAVDPRPGVLPAARRASGPPSRSVLRRCEGDRRRPGGVGAALGGVDDRLGPRRSRGAPAADADGPAGLPGGGEAPPRAEPAVPRRTARAHPATAEAEPADFTVQQQQHDNDTQWAPAELERRIGALAEVLRFSDTLPLHLLTADPAERAAFEAAFDPQPERDAEVLATLEAAHRWQRSSA